MRFGDWLDYLSGAYTEAEIQGRISARAAPAETPMRTLDDVIDDAAKSTPPVCGDCHHAPSGRYAGPAKCYCRCHDAADAAPDLLAACVEGLRLAEIAVRQGLDGPKKFVEDCVREHVSLVQIRAAIAKAKGLQ